MKTFTLAAAVVAAALLAGGPALAQDKTKANCQPSASPRGDASAPRAAQSTTSLKRNSEAAT